MADLGHGPKPFLVVSNNARNSRLRSCVAVRITTSPKPEIASIVPLGSADPLVGRVLCDDITVIYPDELKQDVGALSRQTMNQVANALRFALNI